MLLTAHERPCCGAASCFAAVQEPIQFTEGQRRAIQLAAHAPAFILTGKNGVPLWAWRSSQKLDAGSPLDHRLCVAAVLCCHTLSAAALPTQENTAHAC